MTRLTLSLLSAFIVCLTVVSQQLPQFNSNEFEGWTYNNPNIELTSTNIGRGKIVLYKNQDGLVLTLTSPLFPCQGIDSINATVSWYTKGYNDSSFDLSRAALTMVLDNESGAPLDSVTVQPTTLGSTHNLVLSVPVPTGANTARLRFVAWEADVVCGGGIKWATITAVTGSPHDEPIPGDVDSSGTVNITDAIALINYILNNDAGAIDLTVADIDNSGEVNITDVIALINTILTSA